MTPADLEALAERAEQASGADRGLDGRIAWTLGWRFNGFNGKGPDEVSDWDIWPKVAGHWHKPGDTFADILNKAEYRSPDRGFASGRWDDPPEWTASLDAALTLVPEGHDIQIIQASGPGRRDWLARCELRTEYGCAPSHKGEAATPALALTAAALRARAALKGDDQT